MVQHILASSMYRSAKVVAGYVPMRHEADITPLLANVLTSGKRLCLPLCGEKPHMTFRLVRSLEDLASGAYGIPEPRQDAPVIPPDEIDLLLTPLEAVDASGMRLGKGGGYYDCFLKERKCAAMGCVLPWQWVERVPAEAWDVPLYACADSSGVTVFADGNKTQSNG